MHITYCGNVIHVCVPHTVRSRKVLNILIGQCNTYINVLGICSFVLKLPEYDIPVPKHEGV
jgi:hypothetical protein